MRACLLGLLCPAALLLLGPGNADRSVCGTVLRACSNKDVARASLMHAPCTLPPPCAPWPSAQPAGSGMRNRAEVHPQTGTLYLNAAVVPRIRPLPVPPPDGEHGGGGASGNGSSGGSSGGGGQGATIRSHHFTVVEMRQGVVAAARDVWVGVQRCDAGGGGKGSGGGGAERRCMVVRQQELVKTSLAAAAAHAAAGAAGNGGSGNGNGTAAAAAAAAPGREAAEEAAAAAEAAEAAAAAEGGYVCSVFRAHTGEWEPFVLQLPAAAAAAEAAAQLAA